MSGSTFGHLFQVTNFGESHGPAIGCVIDGCPPGMALSEGDIQPELDRRRPGTSRHVTQRTLMGVISFYDVAKAVVDSQDFENRMLKAYIRDWPVDEPRDEQTSAPN